MRQFKKVIGEKSNISMMMEGSRRSPVVIEFFGNRTVAISAEKFLGLDAQTLRNLQEELLEIMENDAGLLTPGPAAGQLAASGADAVCFGGTPAQLHA